MRLPALAALLCLCCLSAAVAAVDSPGDHLGKATTVLRIDDVRWLEREVVRITAAEGRDPTPLRRAIAIALFRCRSLEGIDTSRPALVAWRSGPSPLIAMIPVRDRRRFLDDFGAMPAGEAPLVRVGERDGTVVLSQNHPAGVRDYRLLIANGTAYLARTLDECRALAANPPQVATADRASVSLWSAGGWDAAASGLAGLLATPIPLPACTWFDPVPLGTALATAFDGQISAWQCDFHAVGEGGLRITVRASVREGGPLASWMAGQRNQSTRLARVLADERTALLVAGSLSWQGQLEAFAASSSPAMRARLGAAWTPAAEDAWRSWWSLWQRAGDTAWALHIEGPGQYGTVTATEQPRAAEHAAAWDAVAAAATGLPGEAAERVHRRDGQVAGGRFAQAITAADRYALAAEEYGDGDAGASLARLVAGSERAVALEGEPALARLWCDFGRLARSSPRLPPESEPVSAVGTAILALNGPLELGLRAELPLRAIAQVVGQLQPALPGRATPRPR